MLWCDVVLHHGQVVTDFWTTVVPLHSGVQQFLHFFRCGWNKDREICRRCKLARLRTEHSGTNISNCQTVHIVARLQVADEEDSLSEIGGSCDCIEPIADSREWVVFLLASWTTGITSLRGTKKRTRYNILHRTSDLKGTRQCGLNLSGPFSGQLSDRSLYNRNILRVSVKRGAFTG